jgi:hypothetical protein
MLLRNFSEFLLDYTASYIDRCENHKCYSAYGVRANNTSALLNSRSYAIYLALSSHTRHCNTRCLITAEVAVHDSFNLGHTNLITYFQSVPLICLILSDYGSLESAWHHHRGLSHN